MGLEAAVLDNDVMEIGSLDPSDPRIFTARVAGSTSPPVAKLHKLGEGLALGRDDRVADKDAGDAYRLMQATPTEIVVERLRLLLANDMAGCDSKRADRSRV